MKWNKVIEIFPENNQECLVYVNGLMFVATAVLYSESDIAEIENVTDKAYADMVRRSKGQFKDFGISYYFDDPRVCWVPIPNPPEKI